MFVSFDEKLKDGLEQPSGKTVRSLSELLEDLLANIGLARIRVLADPPYVALIDSRWWRVIEHEVLQDLCSKEDIKVVHLILEHVHTAALLRCFNAHMPSKAATPLRKQAVVENMCRLATDPPIPQQARSSVGAHRAAGLPWIIAGDINVDLGKWPDGAPALLMAGRFSSPDLNGP